MRPVAHPGVERRIERRPTIAQPQVNDLLRLGIVQVPATEDGLARRNSFADISVLIECVGFEEQRE